MTITFLSLVFMNSKKRSKLVWVVRINFYSRESYCLILAPNRKFSIKIVPTNPYINIFNCDWFNLKISTLMIQFKSKLINHHNLLNSLKQTICYFIDYKWLYCGSREDLRIKRTDQIGKINKANKMKIIEQFSSIGP